MKRIDHVLFQADTDFIAYFDAQPLPGGDFGIEPCNCFGHFIAGQAREKKDVSRSLSVVEEVLRGGGLNADQLRSSFFPALNAALKEEDVRVQIEMKLGPLSTEVWTRLRRNDSHPVI
jgi:hypothetical protein